MMVQLRVRVRRFRCRSPGCGRKVFGEPLSGIAKAYSRRTDRLAAIVRFVGHHMGGLPGRRALERLAVKLSDGTILRATKNIEPCGEEAAPIRHLAGC